MTWTVRDVAHALLRAQGLTTIFGNPGSNELPFLTGLPADFRYILGLHEAVVVAMADGYAQASGRPAFVNVHAASGTGNAMGALTNAAYSRTPLVLTAGQQVRTVIGLEAMLANVDAAALARPLAGFSAEPACAADVPRTLAQAIFEAQHGRRGPAYVSVPYDDWAAPAPEDAGALLGRRVTSCRAPDATALDGLVARVRDADRIGLVLGSDLDGSVHPDILMGLAEFLGADVWAAPSLWRLPFPNRHRLFRGVLPAGIASIADALAGRDLVLVVGAPVFRYHQHEPGRYLPDGVEVIQITDDSSAAARAPFGDAIIADPAATLAGLAAALGVPDELADDPARWTPSTEPRRGTGAVLTPGEVFATLREALPADTAYVVESTSTNADWWAQVDLRHPRSYYFPASGGLGFGMPAAVGVALAERDRATQPGAARRVVAVIGDGSANYSLGALWSAAQLGLGVTFVILRNGTYGALRWFAGLLGAEDAPGMDVPGIDFVALAGGYGVCGVHAGSAEQLAELLAPAPDRPLLIEVDTSLTRPDGRPLQEDR